MLRIFFAVALALGLQARTCAAQASAQQPAAIDTVHIRLVTNAKLQEGIVAVTLCAKDGQPVVFDRDAVPDPSTLVHEAIHVAQIARYGGCPVGWDYMVKDAQTLLSMEAEAFCGQAYWIQAHGGQEVRKTLVQALRSLRELSIVRAQYKPEWELSVGEIAHAFSKACPQNQEPKFIPGTSVTRITGTETGSPQWRTSTGAASRNPLTNN